jgi:hypothetical protein
VGLPIFLGLTWIVLLTTVVLDFAGLRRRRGPSWRWQGTGLLLCNGAVLASAFANYRQWPDRRLVSLNSITLPVLMAGLVIFLIGIVALSRERRRAVG